MRITRLVAGAVTAALLGVTPVALTSTAAATVDLTTTTTAAPSEAAVVYGNTFYFSSDVTDSAGSPNFDGTSTLYTMEAGSTAWVPVATVNAGYGFYDVKPAKNTTYKVGFSGYTATSTYEDNLAPSESAPFTLGVVRNVSIDNAKARMTIKGKVKPDYKRKKVKVQIKKGKKYVKFRTIKTNKKSAFSVRLPAPRRGNKLFFKITVPGSSDFLAYSEVWYTYSYRTGFTARPAARG